MPAASVSTPSAMVSVRCVDHVVHRVGDDRGIESHAQLAGDRGEHLVEPFRIHGSAAALGHTHGESRDRGDVDAFLGGIGHGGFELEIERLSGNEVGAGGGFDAERIFGAGWHFDPISGGRVARPSHHDVPVGIQNHDVRADRRSVPDTPRDRDCELVAQLLRRFRFAPRLTCSENERTRGHERWP